MAGWMLWGQPTGPYTHQQSRRWQWLLMQLALSCAVVVLLPVLVYRLHLRKRRTTGPAVHLDAFMEAEASRGHHVMNSGPGLNACTASHSAAAAQGAAEAAKQLQPCLTSLLGDTAAKQLLQDLARLAASTEAVPLTYQGTSTLLPVSIKVDAPHEDMRSVGPALLHGLSTTLSTAAAQECSGSPMFVGAAAVFQGCVQLLATIFQLAQPPAGAENGGMDAPSTAPLLGQEQTQQLVHAAMQALQAAGAAGHQAAASTSGHVASVQGSGSSSSVCSTQQAAVPQVSLVCLDPPCAAEGVAGTLDMYLLPSTTTSTGSSSSSSASRGGSCCRWRMVLYSAAGVLVDVPCETLEESMRLDLPPLPAGVYHLAVLPAACAAHHLDMAAACQPLFTHPLLVLPPAAASELHHHWRGATGGAALTGVSSAQEQQVAGAAQGCVSKPLAALQHVWRTQLSSLMCDLAAVMLYAAAADTQPPPPPQQASSIGAALRPGAIDASAFRHVLQHLLVHLYTHHLWDLTAVVAAAGEAVAAAREITPQLGQRQATTTPHPLMEGSARCSSHAAVDTEPSLAAAVKGCGRERGSSRAAAIASAMSPDTYGARASSSSATPASPSQVMQHQCADQELVAAGTWTGTWRQLAKGLADSRLEAGYLVYVYDTTLPADMAAAPVFIVVGLGHGVLTDAFTPDTPLWQQLVARLCFIALFTIPSILLLVLRRHLRHGNRRERAWRLVDMGLVLAPYVVILGKLHTLNTMSRLLDNHWRSWAVLVVGQGAFTMCCRQTRTRTWLPVTVFDYMGWFAAAVLVQGHVLAAALRYLCVALAAIGCSLVLELRSRRRYLKQLLHAGSATSAATAGKGGDWYDKCHTN